MDEYQELWDDWELLEQLEELEDEEVEDHGAIGRKRRRIVKGKMWQQVIPSVSFSICH